MEHVKGWYKKYNGHLNSPFFKTVKSLDWFEQSSTFQTTYRTAFGGFLSILLFVGILGYVIYRFVVEINTPFDYLVTELETEAPLYLFPFREKDFTAVISLQEAATGSFISAEKTLGFGRFFVTDQAGNGFPTSECFGSATE